MKKLNIAPLVLITTLSTFAHANSICENPSEKLTTLLEVYNETCEDQPKNYIQCLDKAVESMQADFLEIDLDGYQHYVNKIQEDCSHEETQKVKSSIKNKVKYVTDFNFSSDQEFDGHPFGGISALSYDQNTNTLTAISDDFGRFSNPRTVQFKLTQQENKFKLDYQSTNLLLDKDGSIIPYTGYSGGFDAEGLIDLGNGDGFIASTETYYDEGFFHHIKDNQIVGKMTAPTMYRPHEMTQLEDIYIQGKKAWKTLDTEPSMWCRFLGAIGLSEWGCGIKKVGNQWKKEVQIPASVGNELRTYIGGGIEHNKGFEGLGITPKKDYIFATTESPIMQDNPRYDLKTNRIAPFTKNSPKENLVRILRFNRERLDRDKDVFTPENRNEFLYKYDSATGNGVSEILPLSKNKALVMERGFDSSTRITSVKIYEINLYGQTDIKDYASVLDYDYNLPVQKTLLVDLNKIQDQFSAGFRSVDNYEAMTLGPKLPNGKQSLILATDNNFRGRQLNQFLVLELPYRWKKLHD